MSKRFGLLLGAVIILLAFFPTGCKDPESPPGASITSIDIDPKIPTVEKGKTLEFTATVNSTDNIPGDVTWKLEGNSAGTTLTKNSTNPLKATLFVNSAETASSLTVTVTSVRDANKSASAKVTITGGGTNEPSVTIVSIDPLSTPVNKGSSKDFTVEVLALNGADNTVEWKVTGATNLLTKIESDVQNNHKATLSVAADETIRPEASFSFKNKTVRLRLKPAYSQQIRSDVEDAIHLCGNLTESYWQRIRTLAIKYWEEFDRNEIFEEVNQDY